jgi:lipopolysaccharide/colanic/teichoic acid biosynthesis glycosyltransferase
MVGMVAAIPVFLVIGVAIKLSSPGPVLFRQRRVGLNGMVFTMFKFRTMRHGVSDSKHREYVSTMVSSSEGAARNGDAFKLVNDDRVTAIGRFLRRTSLDELPQLLNVLRGEMSLVGPRPPIEYEVALYQPWQMERLRVRPGMTGLWQVSGRNRHAYVDMCRIDVQYVATWTFAGDLLIVLRTPWEMVHNSGGAA